MDHSAPARPGDRSASAAQPSPQPSPQPGAQPGPQPAATSSDHQTTPAAPTLVLASSSPYRRELLGRLRLAFLVDRPDVDETALPGEAPAATAVRLALAKARAVAARHPGALVIGSDQVACCDGRQIGKPGDHARAVAQLRAMRGREVVYSTALCLLDGRGGAAGHAHQGPAVQHDVASVRVRFRDLDDATIEQYLRIEQPYDVAGSAKCEGLGIALLERIDNDDPSALVGLPLIRLVTMLRRVGYPVLGGPVA